MTDYPAGWYDDPKDEGQERYWDGAQWTHEVRKIYPPGWYEDPDRFGAERYWDGRAFTDERRYVTRLDDVFVPVTVRKNEFRLVVSGEHLSWGESSIRWDDVTGFDAITHVYQGFVNHYEITATGEDSRLKIELAPEGRDDQRTANAFAVVNDQAHRVLTPRILRELFARGDGGDVVEYEKVAVSPRGFAKGVRDTPVPWAEFGGWRIQNGVLEVERMKGDKAKKAFRVRLTQLGRWVVPALLEDYSSRFSEA